ncbi:MAG: cytochrome P450 [Actinomycetota bacterium]
MYDLTDLDATAEQRDAQLQELRDHDPVAWDDRNGWWLITRHADVTAVSRDTERFTNTKGVTFFNPVMLSMITTDPPEHTQIRRMVSKQFTPRMVNQLRDLAAERVSTGIDRLLDDGGGDFVDTVAVPMTLSVIMQMLGIRAERLDDIRRWSDDMMLASGRFHVPGVVEKAMAAAQAWHAHLATHIDDKRNRPGTDLLSLVASDDERPLTDEELHEFALLLIVAGNETTRHTSSFMIELLARHPETVAELQADRSLVPAAVTEVLRHTSVVRTMSRHANVDVVLGDKTIRAGDMVNLLYPSANRDADVFADPYHFDIHRSPNPQIAFGIGTHYCLGANLAQLQIGVALEGWLDRIDAFEVTDLALMNTGVVSGVERLVVEVR